MAAADASGTEHFTNSVQKSPNGRKTTRDLDYSGEELTIAPINILYIKYVKKHVNLTKQGNF